MRLTLPRRNKRWQATWPDTVLQAEESGNPLGHDLGNLPPAFQPAPPKIRRWLMTAFVLLTVVLLGVVTWLSYRYQQAQVSAVLEEDSARAAAQIRTQLLRDTQTWRLLIADTSDAQTQKNLKQRVQQLLSERPDVVRVQWWQVSAAMGRQMVMEVVSNAAPDGLHALTNDGSGKTLPSEALLALETARVSGQAQFSQPYYLALGSNLGMESMDLWVPRSVPSLTTTPVRFELRTTYSLVGILNEHVQKDIANDHDLALVLADGTYLARRQLMRRAALGESFSSLVDIPGVPLQLKATNLKTIARFIPNFLTTLVVALGVVLVTTLVILLQDVRKRLAVQRALQLQNALRKAMEDSLITGLRARNMAGFVTYVNPSFCTMVGFTAEELIGRGPPMPYWAPEGLQEYQARHAKMLAGTISKEGFETTFMRKNGERFPVLIFEAPLLDANRKQTGWMSSILDATEQRRMEATARLQQDQLAAQARLATMGELSTSLSHELNQPLAAISSYATATLNMMKMGTAAPGDVQEGLERISKQAQRAGQVIRSVHNFVQRKAPVREVIDLRSVLNGIYPLIDLQSKQAGVVVRTKFSQYVADVLADRLMVEQVILNLTRNAMDAMKGMEAPRRVLEVAITSHENEGRTFTRLTVADLGTGIAADKAAEVFSAFFSTKAEGMGMGLAICRSVVEQAYGKLWHEARPDGLAGCVFITELPAYVQNTEATLEPATEADKNKP